MWQYWLIAAGIFFVAEMFTAGFLVFWLGIAALLAMIVSLFIPSLMIQTVVFIIASAILLLATKPFVKKFMNVKETKTNAFSIVGKTALVIKNIDSLNHAGQIKVEGEVWSAVDENGNNIKEGTQVEVVAIDGVKAVVTSVSSH